MILLTRKESLKVWIDCGRCCTWGEYAEALNKAQLKKVVEWGCQHCEHDKGNLQAVRAYCPICWQALLKEAE